MMVIWPNHPTGGELTLEVLLELLESVVQHLKFTITGDHDVSSDLLPQEASAALGLDTRSSSSCPIRIGSERQMTLLSPIFKIRIEQMQMLQGVVDERFITRLIQDWVDEEAVIDDETLRSACRAWLADGRRFGFETEYELAIYCDARRRGGLPFAEGTIKAGRLAVQTDIPARVRAEMIAAWLAIEPPDLFAEESPSA